VLAQLLEMLQGQKLALSTWCAAWGVLSALASTGHGAVAALKLQHMLPQMQQRLQDLARRGQNSRMPAILDVLANLTAQPQGQMALLKQTGAASLPMTALPQIDSTKQMQHSWICTAAFAEGTLNI
jgi:hypothetical protein